MFTLDSHPRGLRYLNAAVAGHCFAWYVLYNLFVLWQVSQGASATAAAAAFGNLVAVSYLIPLLGGVVADGARVRYLRLYRAACPAGPANDPHTVGFHPTKTRIRSYWDTLYIPGLGFRNAALLGAACGFGGFLALALAAPLLPSVTLVAFGVGLLKPALASMVGRMLPAGSAHAEEAFARYYSFINVGAVASPIVGGWLSESYGYRWAFAAAIAGYVICAAALLLGRRHLAVTEQRSSLAAALGDVEPAEGYAEVATAHESLPTHRELRKGEKIQKGDEAYTWVDPECTRLDWVTIKSIDPGMFIDENHVKVRRNCAVEAKASQRRRLVALWIFFALAALAFWPAYAQNGSGLNLWALQHTDRTVIWRGHVAAIPAAWFAAINSVLCIAASSWLVRRVSKYNLSLSTSTAVGYLLMAASFLVLVEAPQTAAHGGYLVAAIALSSFSEILISTIGLAQVARLAPRSATSTYMALWFCTVAVGGKLAGTVGALPLRSSFVLLAAVCVVATAATLLLRRRLDVVSGDAAQIASSLLQEAREQQAKAALATLHRRRATAQTVRLLDDVVPVEGGGVVLLQWTLLDVTATHDVDGEVRAWWCRRQGDETAPEWLVFTGEAEVVLAGCDVAEGDGVAAATAAI